MREDRLIAQHPFFGPVVAQSWRILFAPPSGRPGLCYMARSDYPLSQEEGYAAMGARLAAYETFCRNLDAHDACVQAHFRTWPSSAGAFELVGVNASMQGALPLGIDNNCDLAPPPRPFGLEYISLDEDAWAFAQIPFYPGRFYALFDEAGVFAGVHGEVEQGMRSLPPVLPQSRWKKGWRHPFFGRHGLSEMCKIATVPVDGRKIAVELVMSRRAMCLFEPEQLDPFAPIVQRLAELDKGLRADFPEETRHNWLHDTYDEANAHLRPALRKLFPAAEGPDDVSPADFCAALKLKRAFVSFESEDDGPTLVLDYAMPARIDGPCRVFAATFRPDGTLLGVWHEG